MPRYETPLAVEASSESLWEQHIDIPARDRRNTLALTLGGTLFSPALGSADALPVAALYWRRENSRSRTRLVLSAFENELDHALKYDDFEVLAHLENTAIPFPSTEIVGGREVKASSIVWGEAAAWVGAGYRFPVAPYQMDNDLRVQLFYEGATCIPPVPLTVARMSGCRPTPPPTVCACGCGTTGCAAISWNCCTRGWRAAWTWSGSGEPIGRMPTTAGPTIRRMRPRTSSSSPATCWPRLRCFLNVTG